MATTKLVLVILFSAVSLFGQSINGYVASVDPLPPTYANPIQLRSAPDGTLMYEGASADGEQALFVRRPGQVWQKLGVAADFVPPNWNQPVAFQPNPDVCPKEDITCLGELSADSNNIFVTVIDPQRLALGDKSAAWKISLLNLAKSLLVYSEYLLDGPEVSFTVFDSPRASYDGRTTIVLYSLNMAQLPLMLVQNPDHTWANVFPAGIPGYDGWLVDQNQVVIEGVVNYYVANLSTNTITKITPSNSFGGWVISNGQGLIEKDLVPGAWVGQFINFKNGNFTDQNFGVYSPIGPFEILAVNDNVGIVGGYTHVNTSKGPDAISTVSLGQTTAQVKSLISYGATVAGKVADYFHRTGGIDALGDVYLLAYASDGWWLLTLKQPIPPPPPPPPVINSLLITPAVITLGQSAALSWSVVNASSINLSYPVKCMTGTGCTTSPPGCDMSANSCTITPTATTTYTLTATNSGGSSTASATVTVRPARVQVQKSPPRQRNRPPNPSGAV